MNVVYMAGPINGCNDDEANGWRETFDRKMRSIGNTTLDPMVRDYRGREDESVKEIVELDIADIDACDVFLAYCWQTSWGTAMEIFYAWRAGKKVILVVPEGSRISPWLRYHSTDIVTSLDRAAEYIHQLY